MIPGAHLDPPHRLQRRVRLLALGGRRADPKAQSELCELHEKLHEKLHVAHLHTGYSVVNYGQLFRAHLGPFELSYQSSTHSIHDSQTFSPQTVPRLN